MSDENRQPEFCFQKKLGVHEISYGNIKFILEIMERLLVCMKETNEAHKVECEFFRLDFRESYFSERTQFPIGSLILHMKWGSKKELQEKTLNEKREIRHES